MGGGDLWPRIEFFPSVQCRQLKGLQTLVAFETEGHKDSGTDSRTIVMALCPVS